MDTLYLNIKKHGLEQIESKSYSELTDEDIYRLS
jgi:hypothetical protein